MTQNYVFDMGQGYFQPMVYCRDFQPHIEGQQALNWEQSIFLRFNLMSHFSSLIYYRPLFRFLMIPSWALRSDERQSGHYLKCLSYPYEPSSYDSPIQRWIDQYCGDTSRHDLAPTSHPHEFDSIFDYVALIIPTHDCFVLDIFFL
jgi:hypothetical protein